MQKIKQWIVTHKLLSIIISSVLVVGVSLAVILPLALAHEHTYSDDWSKDATYHWHECIGKDCKDKKDNSKHTFVEKHDNDNHWQECSVCGYKQEGIAHTFIEKHDGDNHWQECSCGAKKDEVAHTFETKYDDNNHWQECSCGAKKDEVAHDFETAEQNIDTHKLRCQNCDYVTELLAHDYEYLSDDDKHWQVCKDCNKENDPVDHTFVKKYDDTQYWQECSICGHQKEKITATVDETTFANALEFKDAEGNLYLNWEVEVKNKSGEVIKIAKMTENASYEYDTLYSKTAELDALYRILANVNGKARTLNKYNDSGMWVKTNEYSAGKYTNDTLANLPKSTLSAFWPNLDELEFTYNKEDQMYHAVEYSDPSQFYYDIKFENGKIVNYVYTVKIVSGDVVTTVEIYTFTISYGNTTIDLPENSEIATPIAYNSTAFSYKLESASLSEGANWFMINVTDELFNANKDTVTNKCEILGEFTTSDSATFTIIVKDENGTQLDNIASDSNEFDCEITTAGKYYIKVTASADCTGTWDIGFADLSPVAGSTKETAISIDWSSIDSKFLLSDIELSTTDKWFVFEITEDQYNSHKGKVTGCKVGGSVTLSGDSDATLTISVEAESGSSLVNGSSTANGMSFENIGAGKYYIKISATENCTGSLSLAFLKIISI